MWHGWIPWDGDIESVSNITCGRSFNGTISNGMVEVAFEAFLSISTMAMFLGSDPLLFLLRTIAAASLAETFSDFAVDATAAFHATPQEPPSETSISRIPSPIFADDMVVWSSASVEGLHKAI